MLSLHFFSIFFVFLIKHNLSFLLFYSVWLETFCWKKILLLHPFNQLFFYWHVKLLSSIFLGDTCLSCKLQSSLDLLGMRNRKENGPINQILKGLFLWLITTFILVSGGQSFSRHLCHLVQSFLLIFFTCFLLHIFFIWLEAWISWHKMLTTKK